MQETATRSIHKSFAAPDEVREFPLGPAEILEIGGGEVGRYTVQPGWRWSEHIKPIAADRALRGAALPVPRLRHAPDPRGGRDRVRHRPGEVSMLTPGHDAWVVGDEPVTVVDWGGAHNWAKPH